MRIFCFGLCLMMLTFSCEDKKDGDTNSEDNLPTNTEESVKTVPEAIEKVTEIKEKEEKEIAEEPSPALTVDHYICYNGDENSKLQIWISFTEDGKAIQVMYKGQDQAIDLVYDKEEHEKGGSYPTIIQYYNEMYEGKKNGIYKLTHSGNWDYVAYTRAKDQKKFNFTIDHEQNPYGAVACF